MFVCVTGKFPHLLVSSDVLCLLYEIFKSIMFFFAQSFIDIIYYNCDKEIISCENHRAFLGMFFLAFVNATIYSISSLLFRDYP